MWGTAPFQSRGLGCACEGSPPGWFLISPEHLSFRDWLWNWGRGRGNYPPLRPRQPEPAGGGRRKTISSCGLRGSSPPNLVREMVSTVFTSQVGVSPEERRFAGVCACARVHTHPRVPVRVPFPLAAAVAKRARPHEWAPPPWPRPGRGHAAPAARLPRRALLWREQRLPFPHVGCGGVQHDDPELCLHFKGDVVVSGSFELISARPRCRSPDIAVIGPGLRKKKEPHN